MGYIMECYHHSLRHRCQWKPDLYFMGLGLDDHITFFKWAHPGLFFFIFVFSIISNWQINFCQCWDLNHGSLVSEATALPTVPQPQPNDQISYHLSHSRARALNCLIIAVSLKFFYPILAFSKFLFMFLESFVFLGKFFEGCQTDRSRSVLIIQNF